VTTFGVPLFCTRVELADDGEILVRGPTVAPGAVDPREPGLLRTGDLGEWAPDGTLRIVGRKSDTIVTGGENVAPAEVEAVLEAHPAVLEAAVVGRPDPEWGERIVALVRPRPGAPAPMPDALRDHCAASLARYKLPKEYIFIERPLPRTASGKLLRHRIEVDAAERR